MIQFNLLPDIKIEFIKTQRMKHTVILGSIIVAAVSFGVMVAMYLGVAVFQKQHMDDLSADIKTKSAELKGIKDLDKILTIQNQLNSLGGLHDQKPVASRLPNYLVTVTPPGVTLANIKVDFVGHSLTVIGAADKIATVNKYVDTLKFASYYEFANYTGQWRDQTKYKTGDSVERNGVPYISLNDHTSSKDSEPGAGGSWKNSWKEHLPTVWTADVDYKTGDVVKYNGTPYISISDHKSSKDSEPSVGKDAAGTWKELPKAFSQVVLTSFSKDEKAVNYNITMKYDESIFNVTKGIHLTVPNIITTRSETEKPNVTFEPLQGEAPKSGEGQ